MFYLFYLTHRRAIANALLCLLTFFLLLKGFQLFISIAAPLFLGFLLFLLFEPLAAFLHRKGLKKSVATLLSFLSFLLFLGLVFFILFAIVHQQIQHIAAVFPLYAATIQSFVERQADLLQHHYQGLSPEQAVQIKEQAGMLIQKASAVASAFFLNFFSALSSSIKWLITLLAGFLFAYFLSVDSSQWSSFFRRHAPAPLTAVYAFLVNHVLKGIRTYLAAQAKLIFLTFLLVFASLLALGVPNALTIALVAAILDILPLLGVSALFIPWILYLFITGNASLALWLSALLLVVIGARNILEPKITGDSLGVNASVMFASLVVAANVLGVAGLILSPFLILLVKELFVQGHLARWFAPPAK